MVASAESGRLNWYCAEQLSADHLNKTDLISDFCSGRLEDEVELCVLLGFQCSTFKAVRPFFFFPFFLFVPCYSYRLARKASSRSLFHGVIS